MPWNGTIAKPDSQFKTMKKESKSIYPTAESRVKVRYAETDQMGVAYYANYLVWFEVGRSQYCNDRGFSYRDMERESGLFLIVAEASCRYKNPARYEDELIIRTTITELTRRTLRFRYSIEREDGAAVATGETLHVLINAEGRPSSLSPKYLALLQQNKGSG
ncbi:MAG TPA: thioesterase family protein [Blastocatellia bacterium]|nr:thioesterase family protein [Blastocatellia bacterium]